MAIRWTCKSVRQLTAELKPMKHQTSHRMVAELLHEMDYSLHANSKTLEDLLAQTGMRSNHHIRGKKFRDRPQNG